MSSIENFWDRFKGQTILKHYVLAAYLGRWAAILGQSAAHLWFVDAFAGRGKDDAGNDGSPVTAWKTLRAAQEVAAAAGGRVPTYHIEAIEVKRDNFIALQEAMAPYIAEGSPRVTLCNGTLENELERILGASAGEPLLIFIDPFGVKGLSAELVKRTLAAPKTELLILFNDTGANRLHGAAVAGREPHPQKPTPHRHEPPDLFADSDHDAAVVHADGGGAGGQSAEAWEATAPASEEILLRAFGDDSWRAVIGQTPARRRPRRWLELYVERLRKLGGRYVLPFSIRDDRDAHVYYLIHVSQNDKALMAMKDAIRSAMRSREERIGQTTLGFATSSNIGAVATQVRENFSGRTGVRWTEKGSPAGTVQGYVIRETDALYSDMEELKLQLKPYETSARPLTYSFPV